ncbi:MAG TPA: PLP-dependent aminotransferase family protein [Myxococcales bacterium]|nr:PLP-dependent aminotransferase family protein [Myxococcales bacterium]
MREVKLYEKVSGRLEEAMRIGVLRPGDRLPSVRRLSDRERVSISTVLQAYQTLEARGLVETRPQSGHYVRRRQPLPPEPSPPRPALSVTPVSVSALVMKVVESGRDPELVPLGCNQPDPRLFPWKRLGRIAAGLARDGHGFGYELPPGSLALRRQLARRSLEWGCALAPDEFVITSGAMEAVQLSLSAVARQGDAVAVEAPAYFGTLQLIESMGLRAVEIPAIPGAGMDLEALERALGKCRLAAVVAVTNFTNPAGSVMSNENKERLVRMLAARGVPLVEDDIYGDLSFAPERPRAAKSWDKKGLVMLCGSFSKTLAPGWRVGWVAAGRCHERVNQLKFSHSVATAQLQQLALADFLDRGHYDRHLRSLRKSVAATVASMADAAARWFPEGTRISRPEGGAALWLELPGRASGLEFWKRALEAKVAVAPGAIFSPRGRFEKFVRLSCGVLWSAHVDAAIASLGRIARELF